jgi:predicted transcriptional regulator
MNAFDLLPEPINSCRVHDHLQKAAKVMCENDCECVPVLDADGHKVGVLTARGICLAAYWSSVGPFWHMDVGSSLANPTALGTTRR